MNEDKIDFSSLVLSETTDEIYGRDELLQEAYHHLYVKIKLLTEDMDGTIKDFINVQQLKIIRDNLFEIEKYLK